MAQHLAAMEQHKFSTILMVSGEGVDLWDGSFGMAPLGGTYLDGTWNALEYGASRCWNDEWSDD